jgi:hypothetical protein
MQASAVSSPTAAVTTRPAEATTVHTRILRCMLAVDDCAAYWEHVDPAVPPSERAEVAYRDRWFGVKSEARVRTLLPDMMARFDAYPEALAVLREASPLPARLRPWICHLHTQLADPIYRRFTGDFLAGRRAQGLRTVDLETVARWVQDVEPDRWAAATRTKFASNLLATAFDVGLIGSRRDPRPIAAPSPPDVIVGYALYLLRGVSHEGTALDNAYLRSMGVTKDAFAASVSRAPGIRFAQLGSVVDLGFDEASFAAWGRVHLGGAS